MLVLSRKCGQSIVIADDIVVNVVDIGRGRVQIGITAPRRMSIVRQELIVRGDWPIQPVDQREFVLQSASQPPE